MTDHHNKKTGKLNRRDFVRLSGGCAGLTSLSLMSTILNLKMTNAAVAAAGNFNDYRALVCVFLFGGNDSFNTLIPNDDAGFADYAEKRGGAGVPGGLAIPRDQLLPITDSSGRAFGVHPGMPEVQQLFTDGNLAFVANVGSLIQPTTLDDYRNRRNLPLGLFSHSDEQRNWQTSIPQNRSIQIGWAGRMADILTDSVNTNAAVSINIALNSLNILQTGNVVTPYIVGTNGATVLNGYGAGGALNQILTGTTDSLLGESYRNLLEQSYANVRRSSIDGAAEFNAATSGVQLNTQFPATGLGAQLQMVARTIGAHSQLGHTRQIFFVAMGGFDNHANLLAAQAGLLPQVSQALKAFYDATVELGLSDKVTTFTASDFSRTLTSNGRGSDHAWGANHMVLGGSVLGGRVYGEYPMSLLSNNLDTGRGRLIPTTSVDEYAAELAMWFGMPNDAQMEEIFPNIRNFLGAGDPPPMGILA